MPAQPVVPDLRLATAADAPTLAALYALCAHTLGPQLYGAKQVAAWESFGADTPAFRRYILGAETWLAFDPHSQAVLGFCGVDAQGEVPSLYVHPGCGRMGLGTRMLAHALAQARARGITRFAAWATPFSRPVFERAGLNLVATARDPYEGVIFERYRVANFKEPG